MANERQILAKIQRNLEQIGVAVTVGVDSLTVGSVVVTLADPAIQSPMGGIDASASPFIGIGIANPNIIVLTGTVNTNDELVLLAVCARFANTLNLVSNGVVIPGHADLIGMGQ
jgi:hypothetical protein